MILVCHEDSKMSYLSHAIMLAAPFSQRLTVRGLTHDDGYTKST